MAGHKQGWFPASHFQVIHHADLGQKKMLVVSKVCTCSSRHPGRGNSKTSHRCAECTPGRSALLCVLPLRRAAATFNHTQCKSQWTVPRSLGM